MKRLLRLLLALSLVGCATHAAPAKSPPNVVAVRVDAEPDESDPYLVKDYMMIPCEALIGSRQFISGMLRHQKEHLAECVELAAKSDYVYAPLMCLYVGMYKDDMYTHVKSIEKAFKLMCRDDGTRKNPEYPIHF